MLHVQGGFLVSIAREACYQADVHPGDVACLRDRPRLDHGAVDGGRRRRARRHRRLPRGRARLAADRLWQAVEDERITSLGLSPTLVRALLPHGDPTHDLSSLRTFLTSGEPWNPEPYRWLYENVGRSRVPIINFSGGTEVARVLPLARAVGADQGVLARRAGARHGDGHRRRRRPLARRHRRGGRARLPQAVPRDDARLLARPRALPRHLLAADPRRLGARRLGLRATRTATGSCTAAPTTRSTSPASASGRPRSSRPRSSIRPCARLPRSASRTR